MIHLKVQGRLFGKLDLSQMLAKLPRSEEWNERGISRAEFFQWKRATEEERKAAGFTLVVPSIQEHELAGSAGITARILSTRRESLVREVTTFSEDVAPSARHPAADEAVAFSGKAMFVQKDGSVLPGNATFYYDAATAPWGRLFGLGQTLDYLDRMEDQRHYIEEPGEYIEERPKDGELVLFTGEAILFWTDNMATTIISGEATFYGPGVEGSIE